MTDKQPEALRLADHLEDQGYYLDSDAAAELRRLHEVNAELVEALENCEAFLLSAGFASSDAYAAACAAIAKATGEQ
jgi:hypothetical protein